MKGLEDRLRCHFRPHRVPVVGCHHNSKVLVFWSSLQKGGPLRVSLADSLKGVRGFDVEDG